MGSAEVCEPDVTDDVLARTARAYERLRGEVGKVVVGQEEIVEMLMLSLLCRGHCLVVGVPGLAKTLLIRSLAAALGLDFSRVQFTPDLMPSDIIGTEILHEDRETGVRSLDFSKGPVFTNLLLADEINRTPPKTQSALLEAMQEHTVTCGGKTYQIEEPFLVFATQNPIEHEGTYPLPEAQLDRFFLNVMIDYPTMQEEMQIVRQNTNPQDAKIEPAFSREELLELQELVLTVPAPDNVVEYALRLAVATRPNQEGSSAYVNHNIEWGAGPRASIALVLAAKALALLHGQATASVAEIEKVFPAVMRHRVIPSYHAVGEGTGIEDILKRVLEETGETEYNDGI
jgi:MoxR-like ATPase